MASIDGNMIALDGYLRGLDSVEVLDRLAEDEQDRVGDELEDHRAAIANALGRLAGAVRKGEVSATMLAEFAVFSPVADVLSETKGDEAASALHAAARKAEDCEDTLAAIADGSWEPEEEVCEP